MEQLWSSIRLKYEEAEFFLKQLNAHQREPKLFYFYLSAFISSAGKLVLLLERKAEELNKKGLCEHLQKNILSGNETNYFVDLCNSLETEAYPNVVYRQQIGIQQQKGGNLVWYVNYTGEIDHANESNPFESVYSVMQKEWSLAHQIGQNSERYEFQFRWVFVGHPDGFQPDGSIDALTACDVYLKKIWSFLVNIRREFEKLSSSYV
ncbi:hypothetical protein [Paenibacillus abyssi]|uniref:Uncharacterized protein n=1 Tax=Paenibacillus abyssi TaxID=1340531 RepID=A0A917LGN5_9BACL|nr:hypothetical protein [Paenibacillus abyssi]GGG21602.1 hypothetical protein GCM10010916_42890 [Paenibacillus abyssi]